MSSKTVWVCSLVNGKTLAREGVVSVGDTKQLALEGARSKFPQLNGHEGIGYKFGYAPPYYLIFEECVQFTEDTQETT